MTQRLYTEMSAEEQALWVADFAQVMQQHGDRLSLLTKGKITATADDSAAIRRIFSLLSAWPFAQDFCSKAQRYGDYMARASRLPVYIEKVKEKLADGLTMTDAEGRVVAYVNPSAPMRRRGRPTREEIAARLRGESVAVQGEDDAEARKRRTIAKMLGLQVVVHGDAPREKNNAEIAAEKAAKQAEYERQNPSLFPTDTSKSVGTGSADSNDAKASGDQVPVPSDSPAPQSGTPASSSASGVPSVAVPQQPLQCPTMSEVYQDRIEQDRLRLSDLAWLCSDDLKKRIETVRGLRVTAESASERAKTMADMGAAAKDIEPYAQQAKEAVEGYMAIYAAVDEELATVFYRLQNDEPFREKFLRRFKGVDLVKVSHICRPYYEKLRSPELDLRIKSIIEQESPEYAAKMKAEEARKEEVSDILRYLKRKDKQASDTRLKTAKEVKFPRLVELIGEEEAKNYYPLITYIEEENRKLHAAEDKAKVSEPVDAQKEAKEPKPKKSSAKSADKKPSPKKTSK